MKNRNKLLTILIFVILIISICLPLSVTAQPEKVGDYPKNPLVFVVPFGYGGGFDTFTRTLKAMSLDEISPVPITVLNQPGAGGSTAMVYTQSQPDDGYTLLGLEASELISEEKIDYKIIEDFDIICNCVLDSMQIYVAGDSEFESFEDLLEFAKNNPGELKIGANDAGGSFDFQVNYLFHELGAEVTYIPYEHAVAQGQTSLLAGRLHAYWDVIGSWSALLESGEVRAIVTTADQRVGSLPDVPTLKELGYDLNIGLYRGFGVKKGTDPEKIKYLSELIKLAIESPKFLEAAENLNLDVRYMGSEEFTEFLKKQKEMYLTAGNEMGYFD